MTLDLLTVPEVALLLRASERFVLDELRRKNLRGSRTGAGWRVEREDLADYVEAHANVSRGPQAVTKNRPGYRPGRF